jgi:hypothetical protein
MVAPETRSVHLEIRRTYASDQAPTTVQVRSGGSEVTLTLTSPEWQTADVAIRATSGSWLRRMHRVDIDVSPAFIPNDVDASNPDRRHLGVQIRRRE